MPLVSVIMPYYKKINFVKSAINSVLNQSFQNFELILIYDDTNLSDLEIIKKEFKNNNKLKIIKNSENFGAGILWSSVIFAGSIAMVKFFYHEEQNKTLQSLLVMPVPSELILFSKSIVFFLFLSISEIVIFLISSVLFNLNIFSLKLIIGSVVFNVGYSVVGSFFGVISSKSSSKEILLTMLLIPIITPILMFIIATTNDVIRSELNSNFQLWLGVGISFDIIFLTLMSYLFGKILEE